MKTILITGCSSGIGLACALGMKSRGWRVLATARRDADLEMLRDKGLDALRLDLESGASIKACAEDALALTGDALDVLFNNAAYGQIGAMEDIPVTALRRQFEVNVFGWHDLTNRLLPSMIARRTGRLIQCSSVLGFVSGPFRGPYSATKFAIEAMSDAYRAELKDTGVKVSLIQPGPITSRFVEHAADALEREVDFDASRHGTFYEERLKILRGGGKVRWKLPPEAVLKKLIHAAESDRPKLRYYVTVPTYMAAIAKRVLPNGLFAALADKN